MKLNLMCMFHNESKYLREWIEFHRMMGVEKFWLYNRLSTDDWQSVLHPYMNSGLVDVKEWPYTRFYNGMREAFIDAHQDCIERLRGRHEWLAMIDADEFLFSPRFNTVSEALIESAGPVSIREQWGAIGVSWMIFGAGDETEYRNIPVIERFTWRPLESNYFFRWYKSIVRLDDPELNTKGSTHTYRTSNGTFNEWGTPLPDNEFDHSSLLLRINHYFTKSRPEWEERHPMVEDDIPYGRDEKRWIDVQEKSVDDRTIQKFLPPLKERLIGDNNVRFV